MRHNLFRGNCNGTTWAAAIFISSIRPNMYLDQSVTCLVIQKALEMQALYNDSKNE